MDKLGEFAVRYGTGGNVIDSVRREVIGWIVETTYGAGVTLGLIEVFVLPEFVEFSLEEQTKGMGFTATYSNGNQLTALHVDRAAFGFESNTYHGEEARTKAAALGLPLEV